MAVVIEVWKAQSSWRSVSSEKKKEILERLAEKIQYELPLEVIEEAGPYLIHGGQGDLLVWADTADRFENVTVPHIGLSKYFEPMVHISGKRDLTAKGLAKKLSADK